MKYKTISHLKYLPSLFCFETIIKCYFNDVLYSLLQVKILAYHWLKPYKYDSNDGIWKIIFYHFFFYINGSQVISKRITHNIIFFIIIKGINKK